MLEKFISDLADAAGLPFYLVTIILFLAVFSAAYIFSFVIEGIDRVLRPSAYDAEGKKIRARAKRRNGELILKVEGREFKFLKEFLTSRNFLSMDKDLRKISTICYHIAEGFLFFEEKCKALIGERWNSELYQLIDLQDTKHPKATIDETSAGEHHHSVHRDGYKITVSVNSMLGNAKKARGIVAHELLHEYVLGSVVGLRYLGEAVTEYIARICVDLPHAGFGAYQGLIDVMTVLVEEKLRHGKDSIVVLAMQPDGLREQINMRLQLGVSENQLRQIFLGLPSSDSYTIDGLVQKSLDGRIAEVLNSLCTEIHNLEYKNRDSGKLAKVVRISQSYVRALEYKEGANHTVVQARGEKVGETVVHPPVAPKEPHKPFPWRKFFGFILDLVSRFVVALYRKFSELKGAYKLLFAGILLFCFLASGTGLFWGVRWLFFGSDKVAEAPIDSRPVVMNRSKLSTEQFEERKTNMKKFIGEFALLSRDDADKVPARVLKYWSTIKASADARGVDEYQIGSLAFQETFFNPDQVNDTSKATGMFQFMSGTAKLQGLVVGGQDYRLMDDKNDYRKDVAKSSLATAELYRQAFDRWGDADMAIWDHHAGPNLPTQAMTSYLDEVHPGWKNSYGSIKKAMKGLKVGYWDLRLRPTPAFAPRTWKLMMELLSEKHDFSADYPMRVSVARDFLLELVAGKTENYKKAIAPYQHTLDKFHLKGEDKDEEAIGAAWWMWYADWDQSNKILTCDALRKADKDGIFVKVPDDVSDTGFLVDKSMGKITDKFSVGDEYFHNSLHRQWHYYARPETLGMAMYTVAWFKELYRQEGKTYEPMTVTSLVRSDWFQGLLGEMGNTAATDQLPLHTDGLAVDFAMGRISDDAKTRWYFVLNELRSMGMISVSFEGKSKNTHLVPSPQFREFFAGYYNSRVKRIAK